MRGTHSLGPAVELDLFRSYLVVLEEGSLNRAAVRLRFAQSSLTRQMQALEHELGGRLLERTPGGVAPTAAGQKLAERVRRVLADFDSAVCETRCLARGQQSLVRVGYLLSATQSHLNPALVALRKSHPEVKVKLLDLTPGEQIGALRRGEIDVGLIGHWGDVLTRDFYARKLGALTMLVALPENHALAKRASLRLADLRNEMFVGAPDREVPGHNRWLQQICRRAGFKPRIVQDGESLSHAFSLVVSENAIGLVPEFMRDDARP